MRHKEQNEIGIARLHEQVAALDRVIDAKFLTFRAYVDAEADRVELALTASDKAITKAETATERRFESVNEFRAQLSEQAATFVTRDTFYARIEVIEHAKDASHAAMEARLINLERTIERQLGRGAGLAAGWGYIVTAMGLALTVATLIIIFTR